MNNCHHCDRPAACSINARDADGRRIFLWFCAACYLRRFAWR